MKPFEINSPMGGDVQWSNQVPPEKPYQSIRCHRLYYVYGNWGYAVFQVINLKNVDLWDSQYYLLCRVQLASHIDQMFIEQHNAVVHHFDNHWEGIPLPTERQGQGGFSAGPYIDNTVIFPTAGYYRTTDFHYRPEALYYYSQNYREVDELLNDYEKKAFHHACGFIELNGDAAVIMHRIYEPYCRKDMSEKYLPLKAEEFLITALEQLDSRKQGTAFTLNDSLIEGAKFVEKALRENYLEPHSLKALARMASTNTEYLRRAFKEITGMTVIGYLTQVRIDKAKEYLLNTQRTVNDIALSVGFCDGDRLGKVFKKVTGETPSSFRGRPRKGQY